MTADDKNISDDFTALAQTWKDRQTIFLIDGSGSMMGSYQGGENPIVMTVNYATELRKKHDRTAEAFFFGEPEERLIQIDLNGSDPMKRYPGGQGFLQPMLNLIKHGYNTGRIARKMHLVIVSDGDISDFSDNNAEKVRETLGNLISSNPDVMIDVIVPSQSSQSPFAALMRRVMPEGHVRAPVIHLVETTGQLSGALASLVEGRQSLEAAIQARQDAVNVLISDALDGIQQPTKAMSVLKIRKPVVE